MKRIAAIAAALPLVLAGSSALAQVPPGRAEEMAAAVDSALDVLLVIIGVAGGGLLAQVLVRVGFIVAVAWLSRMERKG